ncbi:hypothetical protein chiPu_0030723, partial [Chiloscyllium punctatum]|nr:hypothetical protein [Chiloscyllium punctatum]
MSRRSVNPPCLCALRDQVTGTMGLLVPSARLQTTRVSQRGRITARAGMRTLTSTNQ